MSHLIEINVSDVTDTDARIVARLVGDATGVVVRGTVRGPYCEKARTLPAEFAFRRLRTSEAGIVEAVVTDLCLWSPELPHLYDLDIQALRGEQLLAEYHGKVGLRRTTPRLPAGFCPGKQGNPL